MSDSVRRMVPHEFFVYNHCGSQWQSEDASESLSNLRPMPGYFTLAAMANASGEMLGKSSTSVWMVALICPRTECTALFSPSVLHSPPVQRYSLMARLKGWRTAQKVW